MRAVVDDRAPRAAHARLRGGAGARRSRARRHSGPRRRRRSPRPASAERYDLAALAEAAAAAGNIADPAGQGADRRSRQDRCGGGGLCPLGRHQPGRHRHRAGARTARRRSMLLHRRPRPRDRRLSPRSPSAIAAPPTVARTWLQHALPMPFGLKLAGYAAALARSRERLQRLRSEALVLQFGGAAGTLAALGDRGLEVAERLAALLDLPLPDAPWHSHRDRLAEVASAFAILAGTCGKIARDVSLLMQTEVAEAFEPAGAGRGGSSTMPHKRNPTAAAAALAAATIAPQARARPSVAAQVQEHERAPGAWQAEWPTFPALALVTSGALAAIVDIAEGLEVDAERMRANLDATRRPDHGGGGVVRACRQARQAARRTRSSRRPASKALADKKRPAGGAGRRCAGDARSSPPAELAKLFEPMAYQGVAQNFIDRLVASSLQRARRRSADRHSRHSTGRNIMPVIQCRRLPASMSRSKARNGAPVLMLSQFARHHAAHVGRRRSTPFAQQFRVVRYDRRGHGRSGVPQGPLHAWSVLGRDALAVHGRARYQEGQLVRPVDGRHGRPVARRQRARPHRAARARQHVTTTTRTRSSGTTASSWCSEKGVAGIAAPNMERWFTKEFREREPGTRSRA